MTPQTISSLAAALAAGQYPDWSGLPPGVTLDPADAQPAALGERGLPAVLVHLDDPAPGCSARAWTDPDTGRVVLLEVAWTAAPPEWPAGLGEPDRREDVIDGLVAVAGGEWVYAGRGLAVVTSPDGRHVRHAFGFAPTSVDAYARDLRVGLAVTRRPPTTHGGAGR
ncbi:hypothetical protein [Intrasporangium sp.]|uniref:hypothetical protein n=1 Tax=Intrasporangium sp. TaxID=1925024 RepID=UPI0032221F67